jgi:hypothetical protein
MSSKKLFMPQLTNSEAVLAQFNRLLRELLGGGLHRHTFRPWEIEILLDIESWSVKGPKRGTILRRYQKAVQRMMEQGARMPLRFAEYLETLEVGSAVPSKPAVSERALKLVPPREKKSPRQERFARGPSTSSFSPLGREE